MSQYHEQFLQKEKKTNKIHALKSYLAMDGDGDTTCIHSVSIRDMQMKNRSK